MSIKSAESKMENIDFDLKHYPSVFKYFSSQAISKDKNDDLLTFTSSINFPKLIQEVQKKLTLKKGILVTSKKSLWDTGISNDDLPYIINIINSCNHLVKNKQIVISDDFKIKSLSPIYFAAAIIDTTINGQNYKLTVESRWYGTEFYISKALLQKIIDLARLTGSAVGVAAGLAALGVITSVSAPVLGLIAAIIFLGAQLLQTLDFCNGIYIVLTPLGSFIPYPA